MPSKSRVRVSFRIAVDSRLLGMLYIRFLITAEFISEKVCRLTSRRYFWKWKLTHFARGSGPQVIDPSTWADGTKVRICLEVMGMGGILSFLRLKTCRGFLHL